MGTQTAFDLNIALGRWRDALAEQSLGSREIEELEEHLHDTIAGLKEAGTLSEEETFLVARRRVGDAEALGEQFRVVKPLLAWKQRGLWMLTGVLLLWTVSALATVVSYGALLFVSRWTDFGTGNPLKLGYAGVVIQVLVWVAVGTLSWRGLKSRISIKPTGLTAGRFLAYLLAATIALRLGSLMLSWWIFTVASPGSFTRLISETSAHSFRLMTLASFGFVSWICWKMRRERMV